MSRVCIPSVVQGTQRCSGRKLPPNWHYLDARSLFRIAYSVARVEWRYGPMGERGLLLCLRMPWGAAAARVMQGRA